MPCSPHGSRRPCGTTWDEHLGARRPRRHGSFRAHRQPDLLHQGYDGSVIMACWDDIGIPYERARRERRSASASRSSTPGGSSRRSASTTRHSPTIRRVSWPRSTTPDSGFIDDPMLAAHNLTFAARNHGADVPLPRDRGGDRPARDGRVAGVTLAGGDVDRGAGRRQRRWPALERSSTGWPA